MAITDPSFIAFLEQQRSDYRDSLPAKLERIGELWQMVLADGAGGAGGASTDTLAAIERAAHGIAGSAATFGLAPLGVAAKVLELALNPFVESAETESAQSLTPAVREAVSDAIAALQRCWSEA